MMVDRRFLLGALLPALLIAAAAARAQDLSWDGVWTGAIGRLPGEASPLSITIAKGEVTAYTVRGAPFNIQYSNVTPTKVTFGDRNHYGVRLTRTGDATASARVHSRSGYGHASLTRQ